MSSALNVTLGGNVGVAVGNDATSSLPTPGRDNRWLTLEVCREFQRSRCTRSEEECKYAHPPSHVEVQNGRVTCCFDSIKGKCNRRDPPCKYLHPPAHLKEQLLQNGRNNLVARSMAVQMQQMQFLQQLSANPTGSAASLPVVYSSSGALTNVPQTMLASASQLYPSAYLGAAMSTSLNAGSASPSSAVANSAASDVNALHTALLGAGVQQNAAGNAASNQLMAALLGQLAANGNSASGAAQQQYRTLQLQAALQAAQQKQLLAASGNAALLGGNVTLLPAALGLQGGVSFNSLQNAVGLASLQSANASQSANGSSANASDSASANVLLQSLNACGTNGSQRAEADCSGSRKRSHTDSPSDSATNTNAAANSSVASSASGAALTGSSTNAFDLLQLDQNQLLLAAASGVQSPLAAKRVATVDARTGLPCYNPAAQSQSQSLYPNSVGNAVNVNIVPSQTASLSNSYQHALLAALSGLAAATSTLPTMPPQTQQTSSAALLQQPHSLHW